MSRHASNQPPALARRNPGHTLVGAMPLDLKTVEIIANGQLVARTWPRPVYVDGLYNLMQRVYMCMVTEPGEVEDDPTYGGGLRSALLGIPGQLVDRATTAFSNVMNKVSKDLQTNPSSDPAERLQSIVVNSVAYDPVVAAWRASITVSSAAASATLSVSAN